MNIEQYIPYLIQLGISLLGLAFVLGKYKKTFEHHEKILDKHEKVIESISNKLDSMNNDFSFMKGWILSKTNDK